MDSASPSPPSPASVDGKPVTHFVQAGGYRHCTVEGGDPSLPPALILHGWIASHQLYRKCWGGFAKFMHYRAADLIGFGDSDKPSPSTCPYTPKFYGEQILALVDALGWKKFTLIAQSMGGPGAVEFAIAHPERLEKLILIDTVGIAQPPPILGRILQAPVIGETLFQLLGGTRKSLKDFLVNDVWHVKSVFEESILEDMLRIINSPGGKDAAYATMMRMTSPKAVAAFTPRFRELKVKTHVIWGEHDPLFPLATCGRQVHQLIPDASFHVIEGSGHEPPVEAPEQFISVLQKLVTGT